MDTPPGAPTSDTFDIISTIRSDAILLHSEENTRVNATINCTLARSPVQFYMLSYHRDRMLASAKAFGWDTSLLEGPKAFEGLLDMLYEHLQKNYNSRTFAAPLMIRIAFSVNSKFTVTSNGPHPGPAAIDRLPHLSDVSRVSLLYPRSLSTIADPIMGASFLRWRVFVTTFDKVTPTLSTRHKTSYRLQYDKALALLPAHPTDSVLNGVQLQAEVLIVNDFNEDWEIMEGCKFTPYFWRGNKWITPASRCGGNVGTTRRWALEKGLCEEGVVKGGSVKYNDIIVLSNGAKGFQSGIVRPWKSLLPDYIKQ
ncbi:MAG: hypothetical protein ASARMPRED_000516 [Alectoria sarmentosa]|nr:MAG: hypothetical protein ASARMPRED_000516 [Alectoria sarmentosa]